jgi:hypothetical protein
MYLWSPLGSFRSGNKAKENNTTCVLLPGICQAFVLVHLKVSSICSTMAGQEILRLLGCKDIYIEYFPEALHQKKKREDKLKT